MFTLQKIFLADFEVFRGTSILLIVATIILIILVIVLILMRKSSSSNRNTYYDQFDDQDNIVINEPNYRDKEPRNDYDRLFKELSSYKDENRTLNEKVHLLEKKIYEQDLILNEYNVKYGQLDQSNSSDEINSSILHYAKVKLYPETQVINNLNSEISKIPVSFSFNEKNGTLKKDDSGVMYLEKIGDYYELVSEKEIYGTAIYLEQLEYNYKILNPKEANEKQMKVSKKPQYIYNLFEDKAYLHLKGEVEYQ